MQIFNRIVRNCRIRYDFTQIGLRESKYNGLVFLAIDLGIMGRSQNDLT